MHQHHNVVDQELLERMLRSPDYRARGRRHACSVPLADRIDGVTTLLTAQVNDEHPRVRLEAVRTCSFIPHSRGGGNCLAGNKYPLDRYLSYSLDEALTTLQPQWRAVIRAGEPFAADNPQGLEYIIEQVDALELVNLPRIDAVNRALLSRGSTSTVIAWRH